MRDVSPSGATLKGINWQDLRRKGWHALLMLASAYAASDPRFAMAVPVLTGMAGVSAPPAGLTRVGAAGLVAACSLVGLAAAWIA